METSINDADPIKQFKQQRTQSVHNGTQSCAKPIWRKPGEMRGLGIKGKEEVGSIGGRESQTLMRTKMPRPSPGKRKRETDRRNV